MSILLIDKLSCVLRVSEVVDEYIYHVMAIIFEEYRSRY